jgi:FHA domain
MSWECPQKKCGYNDKCEGTCPDDLVPLVLVAQAGSISSLQPHRYAICFPWLQLVVVPADGLEIGRATPGFKEHSQEYDQVSRRHVRIVWGADSELYVEDLGSTNGTYINDGEVPAGDLRRWKPGQRLRLGDDVDIELLELNEYGESR